MSSKKLFLINNKTELIETSSQLLSLENNIIGQEKVYEQLLNQGKRYENLIDFTEKSINYYRTQRDKVETAILSVKKSKNYSNASRISIQKVHTESVEWEKDKKNFNDASDYIKEATNLRGVCSLAPRGRDSLAYALNSVLLTAGNDNNMSRRMATENEINSHTYDRDDVSTSDNSIHQSPDRREKSYGDFMQLDTNGNTSNSKSDSKSNSKSNSNSNSKSTLMRIKKENKQATVSVRTSMTCTQANEIILKEESVLLSDVQLNVTACKNLQNRHENEKNKVEMRNISRINSLVDSSIVKFMEEQSCRKRLLGTGTGTGSGVGTVNLVYKPHNPDIESGSSNNVSNYNDDALIEDGIISNVQNIVKEVKELQDSKRKSLTSLFSDINQKISIKYS